MISLQSASQPAPSRSPSISRLLAYQRLAGVCDLATGLLLIVLPYRALGWMRFQDAPGFGSSQAVSLIGAFVLGTGLAYLVTATRPRHPAHMARLETTMVITALIRAVVATFLAWQLVLGNLELPWITVALTDGSMALLQAFGLQKGWWRWQEARL